MTKLRQPVNRMTTDELHGEIRAQLALIQQDPTVLTVDVMRRMEEVVDEIGYRSRQLATADQDQRRKLNWWRTLAAAIVAFGFCAIAILVAIMLTKGA